MAIVNPNVGRVRGLLNQIIAERDRNRAVSPSALTESPIRQAIRQFSLQPESPGSARVASVKPILNVQTPEVVPPQAEVAVPGTPEVVVPGGTGAGVVRPLEPPPTPEVQVSVPEGPREPSAPSPATPQAAPAPPAPAPAPAPRRQAPVQTQPKGEVLGVSTVRRLIPQIYPRGFVGPIPVGATRSGGGRFRVGDPKFFPSLPFPELPKNVPTPFPVG